MSDNLFPIPYMPPSKLAQARAEFSKAIEEYEAALQASEDSTTGERVPYEIRCALRFAESRLARAEQDELNRKEGMNVDRDCAANGGSTISRQQSLIDNEMRECVVCRRQCLWSITDDPFFGFKPLCPFLPPKSVDAQARKGAL